jgi:hypothetical protein
MMLLAALSTLRIRRKPWTKGKIHRFLFRWKLLNAIFEESPSELLGLSLLGIFISAPPLFFFVFFCIHDQNTWASGMYAVIQLHFS